MFSSPIQQFLVSLVLITGVIALGAYAHLAWQEANYASPQVATITVQGEGEAVAVPDIGTFQYSVVVEAEDADAAQEEAADTNNDIIAYLSETANVADEDIRTTGYNLNPQYRYEDRSCAPGSYCPPGERTLTGYEVRQTVEVRVRDTEQAGDLVSGVGARGATNISSLRFTVDDDSTYVAEARDEAIADAKERAEELAASLGVRVVRVVSFHESGSGPQPYQMRDGMGGVAEMDESAAPDLPVGEDTIARNVSITYEVR